MVIDCQGVVSYTKLYGTAGKNECGRDIIQTQNGNGGTNTPYTELSVSGNLVLAGFRDNSTGGTDDGVLIRVNKGNRAIVWDRVYDLGLPLVTSTSQEQFYAITETQIYGAGDIAVVGRWSDAAVATNGIQGLIGRVNGNTGLVGAAPQNFSTYGGTGVEELYSIIEPLYSLSTYYGGLVAVGKTNSPSSGADDDIFFVVLPQGTAIPPALPTGGDPCGANSNAPVIRVGASVNANTAANEIAYCVREAAGVGYGPLGTASTGDFILAGWTNYQDISGAGDAFVWTLHQNLTTGMGALFGDRLTSSNIMDCAYSIAQVPTAQDANGGVILCGISDAQLCSADLRDMLLVKTDNNYNVTNHAPAMSCADQWSPTVASYSPPTNCETSTIVSSVTKASVNVSPVCREWGCVYCLAYADAAPKLVPNESPGGLNLLMGDSLRISLAANLVKRGNDLQVNILQPKDVTVDVSIVNSSGQTVYAHLLTPSNGNVILTIGTKGWPSGVYMVKAASIGRVDAARVIIQ